ncbi:MAG: ABC transporter permease [Prevotellaceae bacterium]|nr:ABC transporter permease [Prevotellaceae bacterium]
MAFERFIARRIYGTRTGDGRFSGPAIRIAIAGVAIGIIVMLVSIAVVTGFKREVSAKVIGFGGDAQIVSLTQYDNHVMLPVVADDSLKRVVRNTRGVAHLQEYAATAGMLKTEENFRGIQMKGVGEDYDTTFLHRHLIAGRLPRFSAKTSANELLLSRLVADELQLTVGSKVFAYFLTPGDEDRTSMRARKLTLTGIFETHMSEYDRGLCFTDIRTIRRLNKWETDECSGIEIQVAEGYDAELVAASLAAKLNHTIDRIGAHRGAFSIRQLAPRVFAWLDVLDVNVIIILVLMMIIGGFTVVSGLLILMLERIRMIGVLKALGATNTSIRRIFRHFAVMLVVRGLLLGNAVGLGLCWVQQRYSLLQLDAETYYIDAVPIRFNWLLILLVNAGVVLISSFVIFGASYLMSIDKPARTIRFE